MASPIARMGAVPAWVWRNSPVTYAVTPTMEPTERSMFRVRMTSVWPVATMAVIATLVVTRLKKLPRR